MNYEQQNFDDLLSDNDVIVDEDVVEDEIVEDDPLQLSDIIDKSDNTENNDTNGDSTESQETPEESEDFISSYLKEFGIKDPSKIQMQDESGEINEVDFNSLSNEEKLNIFKELSSPKLSEYESSVIDYLRKNNTTLEGVIEYYQNKAIQDYLNEHPEDVHQKSYNIDDYSDDEVYLADLKSKYPDFSDEELTEKLESAKTNEELFNKEVSAIRATAKQIEDEDAKRQELEQEQSYQELQNNLENAMSNFNTIDLDPEDRTEDALSLTIAPEDKKVMLRYLLERDKDGKSQLVRDLEDPEALIELAYYRTCERDNLTGLTRYWKNELANERKEKAKLQKELDKFKNKEKNSFVVTPKSSDKTSKRSIMDIYG